MDEIVELIKSIRNRCEVYLALSRMPDMGGLGPALFTILEDIGADAQTIMLDYCSHKPDELYGIVSHD